MGALPDDDEAELPMTFGHFKGGILSVFDVFFCLFSAYLFVVKFLFFLFYIEYLNFLGSFVC